MALQKPDSLREFDVYKYTPTDQLVLVTKTNKLKLWSPRPKHIGTEASVPFSTLHNDPKWKYCGNLGGAFEQLAKEL